MAPEPATCPSASAGETPSGHRLPHDHRDVSGGILGPPPPYPVMGMLLNPPLVPNSPHTLVHVLVHVPELDSSSAGRHAPYSKIEFPKFDGVNPRLWCDRYESYFDVYAVNPALKTRFAILNFEGAAAIWLQSVERRGCILNWSRLCEVVFVKYDKDQYQLQLKQLDSLKQSGSVFDYQKRFDELAHGILLYNPAFDDTYLVTRFLGGLKHEIRSAISLHRPSNVDTVSALALFRKRN